MKAMVLDSFGSDLVYRDMDDPSPKPGQVLIKIKASGVNPLDLKIKMGHAPHAQVTPKAILGIDAAGVVIDVASDVSKFKIGDEVFGMIGGVSHHQGSLAELAAVDADLLALKPKNLSMKEAAAVPLVFITAWEGLVDRAHISRDKTVLIHGGAGGVGNMALQLAHSFGVEKLFATGTSEQAQIITHSNATPIDYVKESPEEYVKKHSDGIGFDIIYDTVGGKTLDHSFQAVRQYHGHVVSCLGWGEHKLAPLSFRNATYSGVFTLTPLLTGLGVKHHGDILKEATLLIESGKISPIVDKKFFNLKDTNDAHEYFLNRLNNGKVVIEI